MALPCPILLFVCKEAIKGFTAEPDAFYRNY